MDKILKADIPSHTPRQVGATYISRLLTFAGYRQVKQYGTP